MPTSYTSLLGLALPVTGELSGTWGDTVNQYITQYLDSSVAGTQIISGSQTAVTLSPTNGSSLVQAGSGSTGSSQYGIIRCTGNPASTLTVTVSYSTLTNAQFSKSYLVINATSTSQSVVVRATTSSGTSSGVTLVSGESAVVAWNGTDFVKVSSSAVDGVSTFSAGTTGFTPSTATSGAVTLAGTLATTNGGTGLTSFTANGLVYASSSSALTTGSALTFNGTTLANSIGGGLAISATATSGTSNIRQQFTNTGGTLSFGIDSSAGGIFGAAYAGVMWHSGNYPLVFGINNAEQMRLTSTGLGIGTSSPSYKLDVNGAARSDSWLGRSNTSAPTADAFIYRPADNSLGFGTNNTERMRLDSSGNLGLGVTPSAWGSGRRAIQVSGSTANYFMGANANTTVLGSNFYSDGSNNLYVSNGFASMYLQANGAHQWFTAASGTAGNAITFTQELQITAAGFTQPVAYADTVSALGNTGTATTINLQNANVFTATLTGNCTFTLSNPIATGSSSFTLILTNDGTAGRTVAWSGGAFRFPGGAASLSRTTTANATDIWVFFTPDGGTTWYGNIAMKNMAA